MQKAVYIIPQNKIGGAEVLFNEIDEQKNDVIVVRSYKGPDDIQVIREWVHPGVRNLGIGALLVEVNMLKTTKWVMPRTIGAIIEKLQKIDSSITRNTPAHLLLDNLDDINVKLKEHDECTAFEEDTLSALRKLSISVMKAVEDDHHTIFSSKLPLFQSTKGLLYTSCFCEENIYHLCAELLRQNKECISEENVSSKLDGVHVVFISNEKEAFPLWCQKSTADSDIPVVWDYHVLLIDLSSQEPRVYDLDTKLEFGCSTKEYCCKAIRFDVLLNAELEPLFRVLTAKEYLDYFSSNRSHMMNSGKEHPKWKLIKGNKAKSDHELRTYIEMRNPTELNGGSDDNQGPGTVFNKTAFRLWCRGT